MGSITCSQAKLRQTFVDVKRTAESALIETAAFLRWTGIWQKHSTSYCLSFLHTLSPPPPTLPPGEEGKRGDTVCDDPQSSSSTQPDGGPPLLPHTPHRTSRKTILLLLLLLGQPQSSLFVGCLTSQQHASVSQGRICSDNFTCCHTETEAADQTFHLTQSQYTDTGPTSPSADPITPGAWQGSHWSANV